MPLRYSLPLAVVSGLLLALAFTDVINAAAWFALAPALYVVAEAPTRRRAALLGTAFALPWMLTALSFYAHQTAGGWVASSLYCAGCYVLALLGARVLARRGLAAGIFGVAALWALIEVFRSRVPVFGFPWLLLGHAAVGDAHLRQAADLLGVYGISFLIASFNAALAFVAFPALAPRVSGPPGGPWLRQSCAAAVLALWLGALLYGRWREADLAPRLSQGPRVAFVQGSEFHKIGRTEDEMRAQLETHLKLHEIAATQPAEDRPALICWGETMVPGLFNHGPLGETFRAGVARHAIPTVFGADYVHENDKALKVADQRWYNSAFAMDGNGHVLARYGKRRLVPFGEFVPFASSFAPMRLLRAVTRDSYTPGEAPSPVVEVAGMRLAFAVCVEDAHPDIAREAALSGAQVLVNLTNDGWFHGTFGPAAHLQAARLRAVETRRPLLRVTNSGITAQIDPLGEARIPIAPGEVGVAIVPVRWLDDPPTTLYTQMGEFGAAVVFLVTGFAAWFVRPRQPANQPPSEPPEAAPNRSA